MELIKDVYFNTDKLVENTNVKVSYTGKFYQGDNEKVFLHYGYGENWNNIKDIEMKKTDLGYQAELKLAGDDTLNFCFKNEKNEWDNNFGKNYIFNIEKENQPIAESKENVNVFWGAKIDNGEVEKKEEVIATQVDAILGNNAIRYSNEFGTVDINLPKNEEVVKDNCVSIPAPVPENSASNNAGTSIALAPTGFEYWSKKIKNTVCSFFSNVPKIISGNYKRLMEKANKN